MDIQEVLLGIPLNRMASRLKAKTVPAEPASLGLAGGTTALLDADACRSMTPMMPGFVRTDGWLLGLMLLALFVFYFPVILGKNHIPYDFGGYNFPLWKFIFDSFRAGEIPLFDRFTYSGVPFLSETQSGLFYPLNGGLLYLASRLLDDLTVEQVQWINLLHMVICGSGVYVLARIYGASALRAFAIALLVLFSGVLLGNQQHPGYVAEYAWAPWLFVAIEKIVEARSRPATAGLGIVIALLISAGFVPLALVILSVAGLYALSRLGDSALNGQGRFPWWESGLVGLGAIIGLMLCAPTWLPFFEFRPIDPAVVAPGPLTFQPFATSFSPAILGNFSGRYLGYGDTTASYLFAGPALWLGLAATVTARGMRERCLQVVFAMVVLFVFGPDALVRAVQSIPVVGVILRPWLFLFFLFFIPFLLLSNQSDSLGFRGLAVAFGWIAATLTVALMAFKGFPIDREAVLVGIIWLAVFSVLALGRWLQQRLPLDILLVLCAIALVAQHIIGPQNLWSQPNIPQFSSGTDFVDGRGEPIEVLRDSNSPYRVAVDQNGLGAYFNSWWRVWRIDSINGAEPTLDRHYSTYLNDQLASFHTDRTFGDFKLDSPAFKVLNVGYVLTSKTIDHPDWTLVFDGYYHIYEYRGFVPRFRLVGNDDSRVVPPVQIVRRSTNRWVVRANAPGPNYRLIVSERWNKAWRAEVNDRVTAVEPYADGMNLSIALPSGRSAIHLEYRSATLPYAAALAGVSAVAMLILSFGGKWQSAWPVSRLRLLLAPTAK